MMPQRIQLKRTKGWRMPDDTVKVDRSSRWGNPFVVGKVSDAKYYVSITADLSDLASADPMKLPELPKDALEVSASIPHPGFSA